MSDEAVHTLFHGAAFMGGAVEKKQLPPDLGYEVVFAGRSNAGKSSAINVITGQKSLARVSKTPGRTREINFFRLDDERRLVDLPGYGYAKVPEEMRLKWQSFLEQYLSDRACLKGMIIIMDIRHPLSAYDVQLLEWCRYFNTSSHILLTKADKLSRGQALNSLRMTVDGLKSQGFLTTVQLFSALKNLGVDQVNEKLLTWFDFR